jgi:hypothetical protein
VYVGVSRESQTHCLCKDWKRKKRGDTRDADQFVVLVGVSSSFLCFARFGGRDSQTGVAAIQGEPCTVPNPNPREEEPRTQSVLLVLGVGGGRPPDTRDVTRGERRATAHSMANLAVIPRTFGSTLALWRKGEGRRGRGHQIRDATCRSSRSQIRPIRECSVVDQEGGGKRVCGGIQGESNPTPIMATKVAPKKEEGKQVHPESSSSIHVTLNLIEASIMSK